MFSVPSTITWLLLVSFTFAGVTHDGSFFIDQLISKNMWFCSGKKRGLINKRGRFSHQLFWIVILRKSEVLLQCLCSVQHSCVPLSCDSNKNNWTIVNCITCAYQQEGGCQHQQFSVCFHTLRHCDRCGNGRFKHMKRERNIKGNWCPKDRHC